MHACMHTYIHTYVRTYTNTHTHIYTHAHTNMRTNKQERRTALATINFVFLLRGCSTKWRRCKEARNFYSNFQIM